MPKNDFFTAANHLLGAQNSHYYITLKLDPDYQPYIDRTSYVVPHGIDSQASDFMHRVSNWVEKNWEKLGAPHNVLVTVSPLGSFQRPSDESLLRIAVSCDIDKLKNILQEISREFGSEIESMSPAITRYGPYLNGLIGPFYREFP